MGGDGLRKVFENSEVEAYRIEARTYDRRWVAQAIGRNIMDPFNIVDQTTIKYYSEHLPLHRTVLRLAKAHGLPLVILWKKPPSPTTPEGAL
jgi:hypothetical protein